MICIQHRSVKWIDLKDLTTDFVSNFFLDNYNHLKVILMVYHQDQFFCSVSFDEVCSLPGNAAIQDFLLEKINRKYVPPSLEMFDHTRKILTHNKGIYFVPLMENNSALERPDSLDFLLDVPIPGIGCEMVDYIRNWELQETYKECMDRFSGGTLELGALNELNLKLYLLNTEIGSNIILHDERWTKYLGIPSLHESNLDHSFQFQNYFSENARRTYDAVSVLWDAVTFHKGRCYQILNDLLNEKEIRSVWCNIHPHSDNSAGENRSLLHKMFYSIDLLQTPVGNLYYKKEIFGIPASEYDIRKAGTSDLHPCGEGAKTLYLLGPCTIGFDANLENQRLFEVLSRKLEQAGLPYRVVPIFISTDSLNDFNRLFEEKLYSDDLVLVIDTLDETMFTELGERGWLADHVLDKEGADWLYSDSRMHTTEAGNEILSDGIIENLIIPLCEKEERGHHLLNEPQEKVFHLSPKHEKELNDYLEEYKSLRNDGTNSLVSGSISMNANPFTSGHRHLVEYASRHVDRLFVFVTQEDKSDFSFEDRFAMVQRGCSNLENVIVLPSGTVHNSQLTAPHYFKKSQVKPGDEVEFWKDIFIFTHRIAPYFGITKRFLGEEPNDYVTSEYNRLLKEALPKFGIETIIIPRKENNGLPISATSVRRGFAQKDWDSIRELVPEQVLEYLKKMRG